MEYPHEGLNPLIMTKFLSMMAKMSWPNHLLKVLPLQIIPTIIKHQQNNKVLFLFHPLGLSLPNK